MPETLVEDAELKRLRAMAEGERPFRASRLWDSLSAKPWSEIKKMPPRERLGIGYYTAARRRVAALGKG